MDSWLQLGVIEPSSSPWGAPVFIVYRNGKAHMVIDLRRFNSLVMPDEFPLPKQEDILQALTGVQWLSSLDALAGFTQLTMTPAALEKLAFRTHRGLYQFRRMPFRYRNGPSVFQRIMQGILAPFLWIFALVYIDDIVIFSTSFEDHIQHLDQVLKAVSGANITLSPSKCHLADQSLLLLGQKVSRLGLSTHKEKVAAILQLREPENISQLQQFLGMMVYFLSYIPFYAWIAQPLFQLLKKENSWNWTEIPTAGREFSRNTTSTWNSGCRYCGDNSHFQNNCPHRQEHARQGLIIPTADGKWHLPNNMQLPPGNGRTLKQWVEDFHAKQQEQASNYYNTYMFLSDEKPTTVWTPQPVHQQFVQSASVYPSPPAPNMSDAIESLM